MSRKLPQPNKFLGRDLNKFGKAWDGFSDDYKKIWIIIGWIPPTLLVLAIILMIIGRFIL